MTEKVLNSNLRCTEVNQVQQTAQRFPRTYVKIQNEKKGTNLPLVTVTKEYMRWGGTTGVVVTAACRVKERRKG